jgi:hypothetical protein
VLLPAKPVRLALPFKQRLCIAPVATVSSSTVLLHGSIMISVSGTFVALCIVALCIVAQQGCTILGSPAAARQCLKGISST